MWNELVAEWRDKGTRPRLFMIAGVATLALAAAGLFIPVVPQVPFAILAAYFFARGSRRLHRWIIDHKHMGPPVNDWQNHRVLRPRMKIFSVLSMIAGGVIGHIKTGFGLGNCIGCHHSSLHCVRPDKKVNTLGTTLKIVWFILNRE